MQNKKEFFLKCKIHAQSPVFKTKILESKRIISEAGKIGKFAVSWSSGKDSTAMTHLVKSVLPDAPIIIQFDDCDWKEKRPYVERVAKKHGWKYHEVNPDFSVWDAAVSGQIGFENFCSLQNNLTKKSFILPLENKRVELECVGTFIGIRKEESKARKLNILVHGKIHKNKNGVHHCFPMSNWSALDVFAYLISNDVEINPCYFYTGIFKNPEQIRLCWAIPTPTGIRYGEMQHLRKYYPEQFQKLRKLGVV